MSSCICCPNKTFFSFYLQLIILMKAAVMQTLHRNGNMKHILSQYLAQSCLCTLVTHGEVQWEEVQVKKEVKSRTIYEQMLQTPLCLLPALACEVGCAEPASVTCYTLTSCTTPGTIVESAMVNGMSAQFSSIIYADILLVHVIKDTVSA
jgi:predicted ester cyclase